MLERVRLSVLACRPMFSSDVTEGDYPELRHAVVVSS